MKLDSSRIDHSRFDTLDRQHRMLRAQTEALRELHAEAQAEVAEAKRNLIAVGTSTAPMIGENNFDRKKVAAEARLKTTEDRLNVIRLELSEINPRMTQVDRLHSACRQFIDKEARQ